MRGLLKCAVFFCVLSGACAAQAQALRDPTRPPSFAAPAARGPAVTESGLVLQTVLISPHRRNATISGRLLHVGDRIAGMRLTEIRESAVVLQGADEQRTLELFPAVAKRKAEVREPEPARKKTHDDAG
jgi:MSHA biogenesis protein MshK